MISFSALALSLTTKVYRYYMSRKNERTTLLQRTFSLVSPEAFLLILITTKSRIAPKGHTAGVLSSSSSNELTNVLNLLGLQQTVRIFPPLDFAPQNANNGQANVQPTYHYYKRIKMSDFLDVLQFWKFHPCVETPTRIKTVCNKQPNQWIWAS